MMNTRSDIRTTMHRLSPIFATVLCLCALTAQSAEIPKHVATTPVIQTEETADWLESHRELNELSAKTESQIAFVGDSITEMWERDDNGKPTWKKYWAPLKATNFGHHGDRTEHLLWRLEHGNMDGLHPKLIVLLIGTNNSGQQYEPGGYVCTAQQTADGIAAIIQKLKQKCPTAKILLLAIFPRGEDPSDPIRKQNEATNALIKKFADNTTLFYLDIGTRFLKPNGDGDVTIQPDLLHLSAKGYQIWAEAIYPTVVQLMK